MSEQQQIEVVGEGLPAPPVRRAARVKICGITRLQDAELAVELGAWTLGMIFFADSPRRCAPEVAELISARLRRRVRLCGVFVDAPLELIADMAERVDLAMVQLHGDEGPSYCAEVARRTGAQICKAVQVQGPGDLRDIERFHVDYHLLDARAPGLRGGTGRTFDWGLVSQRRSAVPLILSGGLSSGNVAEAIAATHPYAVDTASGTESSPGIKDPERMRAFLQATVAPEVQVAPEARADPDVAAAVAPGSSARGSSAQAPA